MRSNKAQVRTARFTRRRGAVFPAGRCKESVVQRFDSNGLFVGQRAKLVLASALRQAPFSLGEEHAKPLDVAIRHVDDLLDGR